MLARPVPWVRRRARELAMEVTSTETARVFTPSEANDLVPSLQLALAAIAAIRAELEVLLAELAGGDPQRVVAILRGELAPPLGQEEVVGRLHDLLGRLGQAVEGLAALGVVVHELEPGQVDLPSLHDGRLVMLCWQYGEPAVGWFHEVEEEFEARRPLPATSPMLQ